MRSSRSRYLAHIFKATTSPRSVTVTLSTKRLKTSVHLLWARNREVSAVEQHFFGLNTTSGLRRKWSEDQVGHPVYYRWVETATAHQISLVRIITSGILSTRQSEFFVYICLCSETDDACIMQYNVGQSGLHVSMKGESGCVEVIMLRLCSRTIGEAGNRPCCRTMETTGVFSEQSCLSRPLL